MLRSGILLTFDGGGYDINTAELLLLELRKMSLVDVCLVCIALFFFF